MTLTRRGLAALLALALLGGGCRSTGQRGGGGCPTCGQSLEGRSVEGGKCPGCGADLNAEPSGSGGGGEVRLGAF